MSISHKIVKIWPYFMFSVFDVLHLNSVVYQKPFNSSLLTWTVIFLMKFGEDLVKPEEGLKMVEIKWDRNWKHWEQ